MALDLSTPTAQLAWDIASRNAEAQAAAEKYIADRTAMQNASSLVAPYGGNAADYTAAMGASDAAAQKRATMAELYKNYVVGMPELLQRVAAEKKKATGGGGTAVGTATYQYDPYAMMEFLFGGLGQPVTPKVQTRTVNPDVVEGKAAAAPAVKPTQLTYGRLGRAGRM